MADAIAATLFRLFVSHRMLLEWITAAQAKVGPRLDLGGFYRQMAGGVALAAGGGDSRCLGQAGRLADRGALHRALAVVTRDRALDQPAAGRIGATRRCPPRTGNSCA